jgi:hypothetical protein
MRRPRQNVPGRKTERKIAPTGRGRSSANLSRAKWPRYNQSSSEIEVIEKVKAQAGN